MAWFAYAGSFFVLYPRVGDVTGLLVLLPLVLSGAVYGVWGGVGGGLLGAALGIVLYGSVGWDQFSVGSTVISVFAYILTGVVVGHLRDLHVRLRRQQEIIRHQAEHDHLTGLANRQSFDRRLEDALRRSGEMQAVTAIAFVDLDGFKAVNDTYGHAAGDAVLTEAAERLRGAVRVGDVVARLGGDEFMVVAPGLDGPEGATRVGEKLVEAFHEPFLVGGEPLRISVSVGVTLADAEGGSDGMALLKKADAAMYAAKAAGKDRFELASAA